MKKFYLIHIAVTAPEDARPSQVKRAIGKLLESGMYDARNSAADTTHSDPDAEFAVQLRIGSIHAEDQEPVRKS